MIRALGDRLRRSSGSWYAGESNPRIAIERRDDAIVFSPGIEPPLHRLAVLRRGAARDAGQRFAAFLIKRCDWSAVQNGALVRSADDELQGHGDGPLRLYGD